MNKCCQLGVVCVFSIIWVLTTAGAVRADTEIGMTRQPSDGDPRTVTVLINSKKLTTKPEAFIAGGRTYVPMRAILEALGATVSWDQETQTAKATNGKHSLEVSVNNRTALVDGKLKFEMDTPALLINGRTFLPLRFTAAALGGVVSWDQGTYTARIAQAGTAEYERLLVERMERTVEQNRQVALEQLLDFNRACYNDPKQIPQMCPQKASNEFLRWLIANFDNGRQFDLKRQIEWANIDGFTWRGQQVNGRDAGNINYGYVLRSFFIEEIVWDGAGLQEMWTLRKQGLNPLTHCFEANYRCEDPVTARGIVLGIEFQQERMGR